MKRSALVIVRLCFTSRNLKADVVILSINNLSSPELRQSRMKKIILVRQDSEGDIKSLLICVCYAACGVPMCVIHLRNGFSWRGRRKTSARSAEDRWVWFFA